MLKVDLERSYLEKALDMASGAATRASNAKGINPLIRDLFQRDAKIYGDAAKSIIEEKTK